MYADYADQSFVAKASLLPSSNFTNTRLQRLSSETNLVDKLL